jgi:hypothetical protein
VTAMMHLENFKDVLPILKKNKKHLPFELVYALHRDGKNDEALATAKD